MFIPSENKIDWLYASLQAYFKIEDDGELKKYIGVDLDRRPDESIHLSQSYLAKTILNMILGMENSSANSTPAVQPLIEKMRDLIKKNFNYR